MSIEITRLGRAAARVLITSAEPGCERVLRTGDGRVCSNRASRVEKLCCNPAELLCGRHARRQCHCHVCGSRVLPVTEMLNCRGGRV